MPTTPRGSRTPEQALTLLAATPPRIAALTADLAPAQLRAAPERDKWSANEVLAHLRASSDVWGDCIVAILAEGRPTLRAVNPRTWIKHTDYLEQDFRASLGAFGAQRAELLAVLQPLPPAGWSRAAQVMGAGAIFERTVLYYTDRLARHERPHLKQIERIVSTLRMLDG